MDSLSPSTSPFQSATQCALSLRERKVKVRTAYVSLLPSRVPQFFDSPIPTLESRFPLPLTFYRDEESR